MKKIIIILLLIYCFSQVFAQTTKPNICSPTGILVNSFTGNMYYFREDISLLTIGNNKLDFSFFYNSANAKRNFGYGKGWTFSFHMRYFIDSLGIVIEHSNGIQELYTYDGTSYAASKGTQNILTETAKDKFRLTTSSGDSYLFENPQTKRVTSMADMNNNKITFAYNDSLLTSVTGPYGRTFMLTWNGNLLSELSEAFGGKQLSVKYMYDDSMRLITVIDPMGNALNYAYNDEGLLAELTNKNQYSTYVEYNLKNAVKRIRNDYCDRTIRYDSAQRITVVVDHMAAGNQFTTYYFDEKERIIAKEGSCCGDEFRYEYDQDDNIVTHIDANGNKRLFTYNNKGNRLTATNALGATIRYTYDNRFSKITGVTLPEGNKQEFKYDDAGNLIEIILPDNSSRKMEYNSQGNIIKATDPMGNIRTFVYDAYGNLTSVTNALGETTAMNRDAYGNVIKVTNPGGGFVTYNYNKLGQIIQAGNSLGAVERYEYDAEGNTIRQTNALNHITRLEYDGMNRLVKTINAQNKVSETVYDEMGNTIALINELGNKTQFTYNKRNRLTSMINPLNEATEYFYDGNGNLTGLKTYDGNIHSLKYDELDQVTEVSDEMGQVATYTYDRNGNRITKTDALGNTTALDYDIRDRLTSIKLPLQNKVILKYDANSNIVEQTDGEGLKTIYHYDFLNRIIKVINAENGELEYTYNDLGSIQSLTDPKGNKTIYEYDQLNRLIKEVYPNNETSHYAYNKLNRIITTTKKNGDMIKYSFDEVNRLIKKEYPDNSSATFTYDALGRMISAKNNDATVTYEFDAANRIIEETLNGKVTSYIFDVSDNKQSIRYPGGRKIEQIVNKRGQLAVLKNNGMEIMNCLYLDNGIPSRYSYSNGLVNEYSYDDNNRLTRILCQDVLDLNYTFNPRNFIISKTNGIKPDWSETYQYDKTGQLINFKQGVSQNNSITSPLKEISFTYDAAGNRTRLTGNNLVEDYTANNINAYTRIAGAEAFTPEYSKNGNMLFNGSHRFIYNTENKITAVNNGTTATYSYDALGRRIKKTTPDGTIFYYYAGHQVIEEHNDKGEIKAEYVYGTGINDVIHMIRNGEGYFYHSDIPGTVHSITNSKGKIAEKYQYDAFGQPTVFDEANNITTQSKINNPYLFTGSSWDRETKLYYSRARYYNPKLGRFMQQDPIGYIGDFNLYRYCDNNAQNLTDPFGLVSSITCNPYKDDDWKLFWDVAWGKVDVKNLSEEEKIALVKKLNKWNENVEKYKTWAEWTLFASSAYVAASGAAAAATYVTAINAAQTLGSVTNNAVQVYHGEQNIGEAAAHVGWDAFTTYADKIPGIKHLTNNLGKKIDDLFIKEKIAGKLTEITSNLKLMDYTSQTYNEWFNMADVGGIIITQFGNKVHQDKGNQAIKYYDHFDIYDEILGPEPEANQF